MQHHFVAGEATQTERETDRERDVLLLPDGVAAPAINAGGGGPLHQGLLPRPPNQDRRQGNQSLLPSPLPLIILAPYVTRSRGRSMRARSRLAFEHAIGGKSYDLGV